MIRFKPREGLAQKVLKMASRAHAHSPLETREDAANQDPRQCHLHDARRQLRYGMSDSVSRIKLARLGAGSEGASDFRPDFRKQFADPPARPEPSVGDRRFDLGAEFPGSR